MSSRKVQKDPAWRHRHMGFKDYLLVLTVVLSFFVISGSIRYAYSLGWKPPQLKQRISVLPNPQSMLGSSMPEERLFYDDLGTLNLQDRLKPLKPAPYFSRSGSKKAKGCNINDAELRVFMYDLPPQFHFGMIRHMPEGLIWPPNISAIPKYPGGLHIQHSPEYWLTADLLTSVMPDRSSPCTAVRVFNRDLADIFFVPFFASLSYNKYAKYKSSGDTDAQLQEELLSFLFRQDAWKNSGGQDHVLVLHHPNSLQFVREGLFPAMFILADFGRYPTRVANLSKDVIAPYKHIIRSYVDDESSFRSRTTLLFFQGAIARKEGGVIRQQLYELLKNEKGVHFTTGNTQRDGIRRATAGMRASKFCLHLAGDTPSSNRFFDAIASHCIPVIISDEIEMPFEEELDYSKFCIFISSSDALKPGFIINLLRSIRRDEWNQMRNRLKQIERHFEYQNPSLPEDAVHMTWKAIARKLPSIRHGLHRRRRYFRSRADNGL